ncbi:MAG: FAD:protein FMN transferase [Christiangramia sp.]
MKNLLFGFLFMSLLSCEKSNSIQKYDTVGEALGTTYSIQFYAENELDFEKALDSIFEDVNASMSTYRPNSDISKINKGDSTVVVDQNFRNVFKASEDIYRKSDGFFDPTVGSLVNAYGFGPGKQLKQLDSVHLDSVKRLVGFSKVRLTADNTIKKENQDIYLDFNAIAKGYTIDLIAEYLESKSVSNYLVELGGELRAKGENIDRQKSWAVGIDDPFQQEGERVLQAAIELKDRAMATSGNYRKHREDSITGQKYVHTINAKTGKAEKSNLLSASVLAKTCMYADGYATTFMAMGLERSQELLKKLEDVEAYLMYSDESGNLQVYATPGFQDTVLE